MVQWLKQYCDVTFTRLSDNTSVSIRLYSKYTAIQDSFSGTGKSFFLTDMNEGIIDGTIKATSTLGLEVNILPDANSLMQITAIPEPRIYFIDEAVAIRSQFVGKCNKSAHIFVCVVRGSLFSLYYPMCGIYNLLQESNCFDIGLAKQYNLLTCIDKRFTIVVEGHLNRSEHEFLTHYKVRDKIICAGSRDNIPKIVSKMDNVPILIFADLGNIGQAYSQLLDEMNKKSHIYCYDYICFEQLLCDCLELSLRDVFKELTLEKAYEHTLGLNHGEPIPLSILNNKNMLKTDVARVLSEYIRRYSND